MGNPIPINAVEDTLQSPTRKFSIDSPTDRISSSHVTTTPEKKPSLKSLISEMGFHEKSHEYRACIKFLAAIRSKDKADTTQIVDLVSPTESPEKSSTELEVLIVMNLQNVEEGKDDFE